MTNHDAHPYFSGYLFGTANDGIDDDGRPYGELVLACSCRIGMTPTVDEVKRHILTEFLAQPHTFAEKDIEVHLDGSGNPELIAPLSDPRGH